MRSFSALLPPHSPFLHTAPSQRENKENFQNTDLDLSFAKETVGFYFQGAILAVDSLWFDGQISILPDACLAVGGPKMREGTYSQGQPAS